MNYKFSVAISVYKNDKADFFDRALESITDLQTVKPSEIVLIIDGPVPRETKKIITKYESKYSMFKTIWLPQNGGLGNALRIAIENCSYDLIARMDSDDVAVPNRFEEQLKMFSNDPELDIIGGNISEFIGEESNIVAHRNVPTVHADIQKYMRTRCPFNHVTVMYRKNAVQKAGGYVDLFWNEDYYLWIRMQLSGAKFANTGTTLVNARTGTDMYQRRGGKKYFQSEKKLQDYMLKHKMISRGTYCMNILKRWVVQVALPNSVRGWVFRTFARS